MAAEKNATVAPNTSELFLSTTNLNYQVGGQTILRNINLSIEQGKKVALLGLNGAGKSTLIKLLTGELKPSNGDINNREALINHLGYQACDMQALPVLSVEEYLVFCAQLKGVEVAQLNLVIEQLIASWELNSVKHMRLKKLSQGNLQKVMIAQAFLNSPSFLLFDEPTQNLDPLEQQRFLQQIGQLNQKQSCLFSSHHVNEAVSSADLIVVMHQGEIIAILDNQQLEIKWFVVDNQKLEQLTFNDELMVNTQYSGNLKTLLSAQGEKQSIHTLSCIKDVEWLGNSQQAIMPLFGLLASGAM